LHHWNLFDKIPCKCHHCIEHVYSWESTHDFIAITITFRWWWRCTCTDRRCQS
jgi:hypothetical protein